MSEALEGTIPGFGSVPPAPKGSPAKRPAKKTGKGSKASANGKPHKDSKRVRLFKLLAKGQYTDGLTGSLIRTKLETDSICSILKDECLSPTPRIKRRPPVEGEIGHRFSLTAAGRAALEKVTIDSNAPDKAKGDYKD